MVSINNTDIRNYAASKGVKMWQIAKALGINDGTFSRKLRYELPQEEKEKILTIVVKISNGEDVHPDPVLGEDGEYMVIASRINGLLNQTGMTQTELGKLTGILQNVISQFCRGTRIPNAIHIIKIADAFNVSADYILGRTEMPQKDVNTKELQIRLNKIIRCINEVMDDATP